MWSEWLQSPLFSLTLTIGIYVLAQGIYRRTSIIIFNHCGSADPAYPLRNL